MKEIRFSIWKDCYEQMTEKIRVGCRGIVLKDGMLLLSYEAENDLYFLPGGGQEDGETLEEGCIREVEEETGFLVDPEYLFAVTDGYFRERIFRNYFYCCKLIGTSKQNLTEKEAENNMVPRWVPIKEAIRIFSTYSELEETNEKICGSYIRDYRILLEVEKLNTEK